MAEQKKTLSEEDVQQVPPPFPKNWSLMTGDEKFQYLATTWASAKGKSFATPEKAEKYERHTKRWLDVVSLKEPDRVPNMMMTDGFLLNYGGIKPADLFYDAEKTAAAVYKFNADFDCDYLVDVLPIVGKALELLDFQLIRWPGSSQAGGLSEDNQFQYVEKEHMRADEYDQLIANPEGYLLLKYLPRIFKGVKDFSGIFNDFPTLYNLVEAMGTTPLLLSFSPKPVREAIKSLLDTLFEAADHTAKHISILLTNHMKLIHDFGTPCPFGAHTFAPFDLIGDTLRCTTGVMLDMYRQPEKLITACEALVPVSIKMAVQAAMVTRIPFVIIPLHKGDDAFMSDEQFIEFYWPTLKAQLLGLIDAGLIPVPFAEGYYDRRLDIIANSGLPKGKTVWLFDMTDMKTAKEKLGHMACIGGNVPAPLFSYASSPQKMDAYCKKLIEIAGPGGGFILSPGVTVFQAKPENMHAFFKSTKKYGVY